MPRVAVVQLEPSYMDPTAGLARIEELTAEAAGQGATLVVFPELLVPGYPRIPGDPFPHTAEGEASWADIQRYHRAYAEHAQVVPGPYTEALGQVARTHAVTLVVGLAERDLAIRSTAVEHRRGARAGRWLPRQAPQARGGHARTPVVQPRRPGGHPHLRDASRQPQRMHLLREPPAPLPPRARAPGRGGPLRPVERAVAAVLPRRPGRLSSTASSASRTRSTPARSSRSPARSPSASPTPASTGRGGRRAAAATSSTRSAGRSPPCPTGGGHRRGRLRPVAHRRRPAGLERVLRRRTRGPVRPRPAHGAPPAAVALADPEPAAAIAAGTTMAGAPARSVRPRSRTPACGSTGRRAPTRRAR